MSVYELTNGTISVKIDDYGAELRSLTRVSDGHEYMWCGDARYWNRVSPVLFPFVGKLNNLAFRYEGREYTGVPQHGYARDCVFTLTEQTDDTIWFELVSDDFWAEKYPYKFKLRIGYKLEGSKVHVLWNVINTNDTDMYFSIGAHPAFWCGIDSGDFVAGSDDCKPGCIIDFNTDMKELTCQGLTDKGIVGAGIKKVPLNKGTLEITESLFDDDALVMESGSLNAVSLIDKNGKGIIKVSFTAPMLGVWSPVGKKAPFVCIEPWYGRCDRESFTGTLQEREHGNCLKPGCEFFEEYVIEVL